MPDVVHELLATDRARDKLGARGISAEEVAQLPRNPHVTVRNPRVALSRRGGDCSSAAPTAVGC